MISTPNYADAPTDEDCYVDPDSPFLIRELFCLHSYSGDFMNHIPGCTRIWKKVTREEIGDFDNVPLLNCINDKIWERDGKTWFDIIFPCFNKFRGQMSCKSQPEPPSTPDAGIEKKDALEHEEDVKPEKPTPGNYCGIALGPCTDKGCLAGVAESFSSTEKVIEELKKRGFKGDVNTGLCFLENKTCIFTDPCWAIGVTRLKKEGSDESSPKSLINGVGKGQTEQEARQRAMYMLKETINATNKQYRQYGIRLIRSGCQCAKPGFSDLSIVFDEAGSKTITQPGCGLVSDDSVDRVYVREFLRNNSSFFLKEKFKDGKGYGYKLGHDGSDGYIDCSHAVHLIYKNSGMEYDYLTVEEIVQGKNSIFREVLSRKAKEGDLIVFLPNEGNNLDPVKPDRHVGIVTEIDSDGNVTSFVSAAARDDKKHPEKGNARDRRKRNFREAQIAYPPSAFQNDDSKSNHLITWRIYRWNK